MLNHKFCHYLLLFYCRKDTKTIYLKNKQGIPISWKLVGHENLGEEFSFVADRGIVEPYSEYPLKAHFRALKPSYTSRRLLRMEVCHAQGLKFFRCVGL